MIGRTVSRKSGVLMATFLLLVLTLMLLQLWLLHNTTPSADGVSYFKHTPVPTSTAAALASS